MLDMRAPRAKMKGGRHEARSVTRTLRKQLRRYAEAARERDAFCRAMNVHRGCFQKRRAIKSGIQKAWQGRHGSLRDGKDGDIEKLEEEED
jgi:hypothetical protein